MPHNSPESRWNRPPQQVRSQQTLGRILDAAEALVSEKNFEDTSVAEIVRRAGSSVGAFYTRFKDKDALLYALHERFLEQALATADDALAPQRWIDRSIPEILRVAMRFLVTIYREQSGLLRTFALRNQCDAEFQQRQGCLSHHVSTRLRALLLERRSEMGHEDPERAVAFGMALTMSTIEATVLFDELRSSDLVLSDRDLAAELTRVYLAYLGIRTLATDLRE